MAKQKKHRRGVRQSRERRAKDVIDWITRIAHLIVDVALAIDAIRGLFM